MNMKLMPQVSMEQLQHKDTDAFADVDPDQEAYDAMLADMASNYKVKGSDIEDLMKKVAWHESKGKADAVQKVVIGTYDDGSTQFGEGPGRGLFQYETRGGGGSGAGQTAMNRLHNYYDMMGEDAPDWAQRPYEDLDVSKLSPKQQKMLFMANHRMSNDGNFRANEIANPAEWSAKYHWRGSPAKEQEYIDHFNRDLKYLK